MVIVQFSGSKSVPSKKTINMIKRNWILLYCLYSKITL